MGGIGGRGPSSAAGAGRLHVAGGRDPRPPLGVLLCRTLGFRGAPGSYRHDRRRAQVTARGADWPGWPPWPGLLRLVHRGGAPAGDHISRGGGQGGPSRPAVLRRAAHGRANPGSALRHELFGGGGPVRAGRRASTARWPGPRGPAIPRVPGRYPARGPRLAGPGDRSQPRLSTTRPFVPCPLGAMAPFGQVTNGHFVLCTWSYVTQPHVAWSESPGLMPPGLSPPGLMSPGLLAPGLMSPSLRGRQRSG